MWIVSLCFSPLLLDGALLHQPPTGFRSFWGYLILFCARLDCVVFGRVAGKAAAKYMLGADMKDVDLKDVTGGGLTGAVESSKLAGGSYEDKMNTATAGAAGAPAGGGGGGGYSMEEVAKHTSKSDCWVVVSGQVLDVTSFLSEHPGGELAILTFAGKDATEEFNMLLDCTGSIFGCSFLNMFSSNCMLKPASL